MKEDQAAFPINNSYMSEKGMSLRDYFAAKAMQAFISGDKSNVEISRESTRQGVTFWDACSAVAYAQADAMLKERAK